jgi:hypothetical protein
MLRLSLLLLILLLLLLSPPANPTDPRLLDLILAYRYWEDRARSSRPEPDPGCRRQVSIYASVVAAPPPPPPPHWSRASAMWGQVGVISLPLSLSASSIFPFLRARAR